MMDSNLVKLFPSLQVAAACPIGSHSDIFVFHNSHDNKWIIIDKNDVSDREYVLLTTLYKEIKPKSLESSSTTDRWLRFLHGQEPAPLKEDTDIRIIQLLVDKGDVEESYLEEAVQAFFGNAIQLIYNSSQNIYLIEHRSSYVHTHEDFSSFTVALESDFFINVKMYVGKFHSSESRFPEHFSTEKNWFFKGLSWNRAKRIYTMETIFPFHLVDQATEEMKHIIHKEVLKPIGYDTELLQTVQLFFENGFNASVTAEKLHIHRNTLQYRLSKFQEITGISVRNFDGALVAYCASLITPGE